MRRTPELVLDLIAHLRLCSIFPTLSGNCNQDIHFGELIYLSTSEGSRQISQTNGTIMNSFDPNYSQYIDVGFQNLVEDFLNKNRAYVTATIWGHGGVGKTACIQKICYDFFNKSERQFSYIIFVTAKDRVYNPITGTIDSNVGKGNIRLYSEVIALISAILFDNVDANISNEKLTEYEQRISSFEEHILIVIDDYETFEDSEKEKISNFLSTLDARYHKAIITTRNKRFVIGQPISCSELDCSSTKHFIETIVEKQYTPHLNDMNRILKDDNLLACIHAATSGRPIFIYQFIRVALIQTTKLCVAMGQDGKEPDKVLYGLDICKWMRESEVKEPFLNQIIKLQNSLQNISLKAPRDNTETFAPEPQIVIEQEQEDDSSAQDNIWSSGKQYGNGDIVDVIITNIKPYGVFAAIDSTTTGLIHISEIADRYIADIESEFVIGGSYKAQIVNIDSATRRISLSTVQFHD